MTVLATSEGGYHKITWNNEGIKAIGNIRVRNHHDPCFMPERSAADQH